MMVSTMAGGKINWGLYGSVFAVNLMAFTTGNAYSWTSPVIPKLKENSEANPFGSPISPLQESWIASLISLGAACGPLIGAFTIDKIGRKKTLIIVSLPMVISYLMTAFGTNAELYYVARFLVGIGSGCVFSIIPLYVSEISEAHNRGLMTCLMSVMSCLGSSTCFIIGPYMSIKLFSLLSLVPLVAFLLFFTIFAPESPYFYLLNDDKENAKISLQKLRTTTNVEKELKDISQNVNESLDHIKFQDIIKSKAIVKGLFVGFGLMLFQQLSGITIIVCFLQSIFDAAGSTIPSEHSTIIIGVTQLFSNIATSYLVDRLGRKILLLASMGMMLTSNAALGLYFYLKTNSFDVGTLFWLPVASMFLYVIGFNTGAGPISWTMTGEMFPPNFKSKATAVCCMFCLLLAFVLTVAFPMVSAVIGMAWTFWTFSVCCCIGVVFVALVVPETKGKTLQEIQEMLGTNRKLTK